MRFVLGFKENTISTSSYKSVETIYNHTCVDKSCSELNLDLELKSELKGVSHVS